MMHDIVANKQPVCNMLNIFIERWFQGDGYVTFIVNNCVITFCEFCFRDKITEDNIPQFNLQSFYFVGNMYRYCSRTALLVC